MAPFRAILSKQLEFLQIFEIKRRKKERGIDEKINLI
jgi:hypothetical protein